MYELLKIFVFVCWVVVCINIFSKAFLSDSGCCVCMMLGFAVCECCRWVLEGEIDDYYGEFFVSAQSVKAEALWREGYQLQTAMLPSFIPEPLAQRILRTGNSIC
jgi:hypothetical protein